MRLTALFVTVLGLSVVACSLATWGITFAFSYTRLTSMAADFSTVTSGSVEDFGDLIRCLINDSSQVVKGILGEELEASELRINVTETQIEATSVDLMSYARNETEASRADLQDLVDGFGAFMGEVIRQFETLAVGYASQMRQEAAFRVQAAFNELLHQRTLAILRTAHMYESGLIDLDRDPDNNITARDCSLLAMMCEASNELSYKGYIITGLATGANFACNPQQAAFMATSSFNGTHSTQGLYTWHAYDPDVPPAQRKSWRERCLTEPPQFTLMGVCPLPQDCQCGFRATCRSWYLSQVNVAGPPQPRMTNPFFDAYYRIPLVSLTYPIYNASSEPQQLLAVSAAELYFQSMKAFLDNITGPYSLRTAVVLNDPNLTAIAYSGVTSENDTEINLSLADSPDPVFRSIGDWLAANRASLSNHTKVVLAGTIWDVFPSTLDAASYFVVVGMQLSEIYGAITESETEANRQLQRLLTAHLAKLAVAENRTREHMEATEVANLQQLEAMKATMRRQMAGFRNTSEMALGESEAGGRAQLETLLAAQRLAVRDMLALHLSALTGSIGWSVAVVIAVFLATLLVGVYGTLSITKGLRLIIQLMEDVAQMHVEALDVPRNSRVAEVKRIQLALGKLVGRLTLYKSFMPAGLFPDQHQTDIGTATLEERQMDVSCFHEPIRRDGGFSTVLSTSKQIIPIECIGSMPPECSVMSTTQTRIAKRNVVAMVVNIVSFQAVLYSTTMTECYMEALLNQYLSLVHRLVAQAHGNLDAIIGDQLVVTFNAHLRCSDAPNVAARTALELQALLAAQLSPRLQLQIGLAEGWMYIGCGGYDSFKAMVALGSPLKVASLLAHLTTAAPAAVLTDPAMEERCRYAFRLRPIALVCLPELGRFLPAMARNVSIFLLEGAKSLQPNEWMYEITPSSPADAWARLFLQLRGADSAASAHDLLDGYLAQHPADVHARWLKGCSGLWRPTAGLPLCERPDACLPRCPAPAPPAGPSSSGPPSDSLVDPAPLSPL